MAEEQILSLKPAPRPQVVAVLAVSSELLFAIDPRENTGNFIDFGP
jgi:hypothetical protein